MPRSLNIQETRPSNRVIIDDIKPRIDQYPWKRQTGTSSLLDQSQISEASSFDIQFAGSVEAVGQTFTAGTTGDISKIIVKLKRTGSPTAILTMKIYADDGEVSVEGY